MQKQHILLLTIVLLSISVVACQSPSTEADVNAINALQEEYTKAANEGDVESWVATFADDAIYLPPNQPAVNGKEAIRPWVISSFFEPFEIQLDVSFQEIEVAGIWAFANGTYNLSLTSKTDGQIIEDSGKFIDIFKRYDGNWKFYRIIYNANSPIGGE